MGASSAESDFGEAKKPWNIRVWSVIIIACVVIYDIIGAVFLLRDHDVAQACRPSNLDTHVIWPTTLFTYVLASLIVAAGIATGLTCVVPIGRASAEVRSHWDDIHATTARQRVRFPPPPVSSHIKKSPPSMPDWYLLTVGASLTLCSLVVGIMAFWGYFELFLTRVWCDDRTTAFEELDLWRFGRATFTLQVVICPVLLLLGVFSLSAPFVMELTAPSNDMA